MLLSRVKSLLPALFCALLVAGCVLIAHPAVEMGVNDDWSYSWSAKMLAATGRMTYNGWGAHLLGWQMFLGAAAIRLFGFSFFVLRSSVFLIALMTAVLMQRVMVRFGVEQTNAVLGTLAIVLCPIYLPLAFSFMSEIPGLFALLLCLYGCLRAVEAQTDKGAGAWLLAAALLNLVGGTARQIDWLGVLVMVPSTAIYLRHRRGVLLTGLLAWVAGLLVIVACMHWLRQQPYTVIEPALGGALSLGGLPHLGASFARGLLAGCLFLLPVTAAFVARYPARKTRLRWQGLTVAAVLTAALAVLLARHSGAGMAFSDGEFVGNYLGRRGIMYVPALLGSRPDVIPHGVRTLLTYVSLGGLAAALLCLLNGRRLTDRPASEALQATRAMTGWLLGPFTLAYLLLVATRLNIYDRYVLPLLVTLTIMLLRFYQRKLADGLPWLTPVLVLAMATFTTAGLHDQGAWYRARLEATQALEARGVPRNRIQGGLEYDAWTEVQLKGYVNDPHIMNPPGAFHPPPASMLPEQCRYVFAAWSPDVHGMYGLANEPSPCFPLADFAGSTYSTWLPPHQHRIWIEQLSPR